MIDKVISDSFKNISEKKAFKLEKNQSQRKCLSIFQFEIGDKQEVWEIGIYQ